jgi:glutamate synthase (ferredoxin)
VRKLTESAAAAEMDAAWADDFYVCSLSSRTLVYKGMLRSVVVGQFYLDLQVSVLTTPYDNSFLRRISTRARNRLN